MMGAWQVVAVSVSNTDSLNQPFLSGSQTLKAVVLALGMESLFELLFRLLEAGLDGRLDVRPAKNGALLSAYRAPYDAVLHGRRAAVLAAASGGQLSGRNELGYRVAVSAGVGLGAVERGSSDVRYGADQAVHRRGAAAGQRQSWRVPLYSGAGRLWGGGCRLQSDAHAQALRAGLAEGAFAGGVRAGHGILRQYHGHSQGCAVQLRHVADALRNGVVRYLEDASYFGSGVLCCG